MSKDEKVMKSLFSLKGKIALVTGGRQGIGAAIAQGFQENDASVAVFDYVIPNKQPDNIKFYKVDVSKQSELDEVFQQFMTDFKGIDILVNCAGITRSSPSEKYPMENWDLTLAVNLSAVFMLCKLAGKQMIKQKKGGSIINVTSIGAAQGFPNNPSYMATKGGVSQLTKGLAYDWGKYNIRVNNLGPGYTNTPMNKKSWDDKKLNKQRAERNMLGRWADPKEMVGPAIFLASDASSYVTGIDLYVDGGWIAKGL